MLEEACRFYKKMFGKRRCARANFGKCIKKKGCGSPTLLNFYTGTKERYNIPDGGIELEFTESFVFEDYKLFISSVSQLHKAGFSCSLDDFGAGQSSLNVLKKYTDRYFKVRYVVFFGKVTIVCGIKSCGKVL